MLTFADLLSVRYLRYNSMTFQTHRHEKLDRSHVCSWRGPFVYFLPACWNTSSICVYLILHPPHCSFCQSINATLFLFLVNLRTEFCSWLKSVVLNSYLSRGWQIQETFYTTGRSVTFCFDLKAQTNTALLMSMLLSVIVRVVLFSWI